MANIIKYYCVGFTWKGTDPENQLPRFLEEGIWENGFEDKYLERVNSVDVGSRIAAKTTYTRKEDDKTISILEIHATGTVIENYQDGQTLKIKWDKKFLYWSGTMLNRRTKDRIPETTEKRIQNWLLTFLSKKLTFIQSYFIKVIIRGFTRINREIRIA